MAPRKGRCSSETLALGLLPDRALSRIDFFFSPASLDLAVVAGTGRLLGYNQTSISWSLQPFEPGSHGVLAAWFPVPCRLTVISSSPPSGRSL